MSACENAVPIRSYRLAFALERRIFRIERYRLPLPYGLPLRGAGYAAVVLLAILVAAGLPVVGGMLGAIPWPIRFLALPAGAAQLLMTVRVDGRAAHHVALSWLGLTGTRLATRLSHAATPTGLGSIRVQPDERGPELCPAVVSGPGVVIVRLPAAFRPSRRGRELRVRRMPGRPKVRGARVALKAGQRLRVEG